MLSKVIFTAAVATSVQAGILDNIGSLHQTSPGIGTLQHTKPALGSIQHTKPALGSKPNKPTRERVNQVKYVPNIVNNYHIIYIMSSTTLVFSYRQLPTLRISKYHMVWSWSGIMDHKEYWWTQLWWSIIYFHWRLLNAPHARWLYWARKEAGFQDSFSILR